MARQESTFEGISKMNKIILVLITVIWFPILVYKYFNSFHHDITPNINPIKSEKNGIDSYVINHYNDYIHDKPLYFGAYGAPRTGSTILYNIIRILVHDKIDPDLWAGYLNKWTRFMNEEFAVVHKGHGTCDNFEKELKSKNWWNKRNISFYTSWRDVKDVICSTYKFETKITKETLIKRCESYSRDYHSCKQDKYKNIHLYEMPFDELITNRTYILHQICKAMRINDVMNEYDYARIENELDNLKAATHCNHGNEINQIHCHHIRDKNNLCDDEYIFGIIRQSKICLDLYNTIRDRRIEMKYIKHDDSNYPKL